LMVPLRRCGSHAIRLRLNKNPKFYAPYPVHVVDFMPLDSRYGDLNDDGIYFQLTLDLIGLVNATMVKWDGVTLDPVAVFDGVRDRGPRSVHAVIWEMLRQAGEQHGAAVVMERMCEFLGLEFTLDMLDPGPEAGRIAERSALWENNAKPLTRAFTEKYRQQLSEEEIELIETITAEHMTQYGYSPSVSAGAELTAQLLASAQARSDAAAKAAWKKLRRRDRQDYLLRSYRAWYLNALRARLAT
jgi:hypothetical protein